MELFRYDETGASYEAFAAGYEDTVSVEVRTGPVTTDAAAGGMYSQVPVAIRGTRINGGEETFAGCYTARLGNPQIQRPPFQPMRIEKGELRPAGSSLEEALPKCCEP